MDLNSTAAQVTTLADNAAKSLLHAAWTQTAAHPRAATVGAFVFGLVCGAAGFAIGVAI